MQGGFGLVCLIALAACGAPQPPAGVSVVPPGFMPAPLPSEMSVEAWSMKLPGEGHVIAYHVDRWHGTLRGTRLRDEAVRACPDGDRACLAAVAAPAAAAERSERAAHSRWLLDAPRVGVRMVDKQVGAGDPSLHPGPDCESDRFRAVFQPADGTPADRFTIRGVSVFCHALEGDGLGYRITAATVSELIDAGATALSDADFDARARQILRSLKL